ncbi:MAG: DEAD/DEAH box helicase family protein, partial [Polyangiaceae bacterium]|nr:DEAD/DEAH box helicase family protein [Polyangiaceae bacterium]
MRAFSIRQPYAEQIAAGELVVEGRKWCPPLGPVLVVASKTKDGSGSALPSGCAICTVEIIAVTGKEGAYEWHLMNPRRVHPFRVKEFLEIFMVPVPDAEIRFVDNSMHGSGTNPSIEPSDQASPPELQPPITPATTPTAPQNRHSRSLDIDLALSSNGVERGAIYTLPDPDQCPEPPAAYAHQLETLRRLEQCPDANPPIGGIVHLPTGAGKTRIALEYVARTLREEPKHRFIWATESKLLIQQTMSKAAELSKLFPCGTKMAWYEGGPTLLRDDTVHMLFLTRQHLHRALARARDARTTHPWKKRILAGAPVTLIYDECHQLGGPGLQRELKRFCDTLLTPAKEMHRWRFVGLSATPIPTRLEAHKLLQEDIFPLRKESKSVEPGWAMHVFHRIDNATLVRDGVLCRVNLHKDESGVFDIPSELLRNIAKETHVSPPGANASREEVVKYAMRFNRSVMSHERILQFMADRLASNFESNGKTIVFVPDIEAANRLVAKLNGFPALRGKVASVHSRMGELAFAVPDQAGRTPSEVLEQFKNQGSAPCILVNVEMLTEGFDDPKVQTVVLAKLTLSTNRFWQMIGRGTRGIRSGGTAYCSVIDPVKLVRLYDYFSGYQPSVLSGRAAIDDDLELNGLGALDPSVPAISR